MLTPTCLFSVFCDSDKIRVIHVLRDSDNTYTKNIIHLKITKLLPTNPNLCYNTTMKNATSKMIPTYSENPVQTTENRGKNEKAKYSPYDV